MPRYLKPFGLDLNEIIQQIQIRNCWIGNGVIAAIGSFFTGMLTGMAITHWWVLIKTKSGYYCAQFNCGNYLALTKHSTINQVDQQGKKCCNQAGKSKNITIKSSNNSLNKGTINDIVILMENWNISYHVISNNCQKFASYLYKNVVYIQSKINATQFEQNNKE